MHRRPLWLVALVLVAAPTSTPAPAQEPAPAADPALAAFAARFHDETLRVDYLHGGDAKAEFATLDRLIRQGTWAGSRTHRHDPFPVGRSVVELSDPATGELLYSRRYDTYFGEYRTTTPAAEGVARSYHESVLVPCPRGKVRLALKVRQRDGSHTTLLATEIDPDAVTVSREPLTAGVETFALHESGDPHGRVDVAIVAEGYTAADRARLVADLERFNAILFTQEPFKSAKAKFNVRGVWQPSQESGCDEPGRGVWKATSVGASFDALGSERYLLTEDNRALRDVAAHVPYDVLYIMINHPRYGGGGIYNLYCTFTSDNQWHPYVFLHEFGHTFAALADEYYTSSVAYNDFYPPGVEPAEPNVTALLDPAKLKWRDLIKPGTPLPTPWAKPEYDAKDTAFQKRRGDLNDRIAAAMRAQAPASEVDALKAELETLSLRNAEELGADLDRSPLAGTVGAFEGAGYASKGLYRPSLDCIMFSKGRKPFCAVCTRALQQMIDYYGE